MSVRPIGKMRNLALRLGKAKVDRIRYVTLQNTQRLAKSQNIDNTVMRLMQFKEPYADDCYVDDIVQGIARLDHQMTKLQPLFRLSIIVVQLGLQVNSLVIEIRNLKENHMFG